MWICGVKGCGVGSYGAVGSALNCRVLGSRVWALARQLVIVRAVGVGLVALVGVTQHNPHGLTPHSTTSDSRKHHNRASPQPHDF